MRRLSILICIIFCGACTKSEFCIEPNAISMIMAFKTYDASQTLVDTPLINATIYSTDTTASLVENAAQITSVGAYLNRKNTEQTFVIFQSNIRDTITVLYKPVLNFISNGCGYQTFFEIEGASFKSQSIDSVNIKNGAVNSSSTSYHLEVIYK